MNSFWIGLIAGAGAGTVLTVAGIIVFVGFALRRGARKVTEDLKSFGFFSGELKGTSCGCARSDKSFTCPEIGIAMTDGICNRTRQLAPSLCANCLIPAGEAK